MSWVSRKGAVAAFAADCASEASQLAPSLPEHLASAFRRTSFGRCAASIQRYLGNKTPNR